jgi:hypothetical protein
MVGTTVFLKRGGKPPSKWIKNDDLPTSLIGDRYEWNFR